MSLESFFENFALLSDVPNGVQKIRELVLQLAVQGKLVPQDINDQAAAILLKEVEREKERQIRERKSKQIERLRDFTGNDALDVSIPYGWAWEWLGNLARFIDYRGKTPTKTDGGVKLITAKNVRMGFISDNPREFVSEETYAAVMTRGFPRFGDILFTTEAPLGNVAQILTDEKVALAQRVIDLQTFSPLFAEYLKVCLMSPLMQKTLIERATGMTATGIKASKLKLLPVPVPPLEEQKRIVAKVDEIMRLCDELEAKQRARRESRVRLNNAALAPLNSAAALEPDELELAITRFADNFNELYDSAETVGKLRSTILQLAILGKLVPQDASDEPAVKFLEEIREQQLDISSSGRSSNRRTDRESNSFVSPRGWEHIELRELSSLLSGYAFKSETYVNSSPNQIIRLGNVKNNAILLKQSAAFVPNEVAKKCETYQLRENDLLLTMTGTKAKRDYLFSAIVKREHLFNRRLFLNQRVGALRFFHPKLVEIANIFLKANCLLEGLFAKATGTANQGNVGVTAINSLIFPLPPLAEQQRIVTKFNKLMMLCDEMESKLRKAESTCEKLTSAAIHDLLSSVRDAPGHGSIRAI